MAEGLLRDLFGEYYEVYSAGTEPSSVNPFSIHVMEEIGIDISSQRSKNVSEFIDFLFDYVVTVCDHAEESCPFFPGEIIIHKGFKDPAQTIGTQDDIMREFRKSRNEIKSWLVEAFQPDAE
jgi:arsenate reductase